MLNRSAFAWTAVVAGVSVSGLGAAPKPSPTPAEPPCASLVVSVNRAAPEGCARVAAGDVGRLPLELDVAGRTVRLAEWTATDETQAELVGFAAQLPADVFYTVRAGGEVFVGSQPRWLHPRGVSGPKVHAIDQVTFCRLPARARTCQGSGVVIDESVSTLTAR